jgi:hypothetical protein
MATPIAQIAQNLKDNETTLTHRLRTMPDLFFCDNAGRGNCMYYAYGISLMYYLKGQESSEQVAAPIFDKLVLTERQQTRLNELISLESTHEFSQAEITSIENILGPAARQLTADTMATEFLNSPVDSSLFTQAVFGMRNHIRTALYDKDSELADTVEVLEDFHGDYQEAEIFRVQGIEQAMQSYAVRHVSEIEQTYNMILDATYPMGDEHREDVFYQRQLMDKVIHGYVVRFYTDNDNENLENYKNHLNTDRRWGTTEMLMILHCAITGEYHGRSDDGIVVIRYQTPISLGIYSNGAPASPGLSRKDIILDNLNIDVKVEHWVSQVPPHVKPEVSEAQLNAFVSAINTYKEEQTSGWTDYLCLSTFFCPSPIRDLKLEVADSLLDAVNNYRHGNSVDMGFMDELLYQDEQLQAMLSSELGVAMLGALNKRDASKSDRSSSPSLYTPGL